LTTASERHVPWRAAREDQTVDIDGVRLTVLSPDSAEIADAPDANAASVVVMAEFKGVRILLTGDAERDVEARLARALWRTIFTRMCSRSVTTGAPRARPLRCSTPCRRDSRS
jgi:beta-lactamase superfamily II metal-dependent hydrolase